MIALTGGTGFLGSHIADALLAAGHEVRVAVRPTSDCSWLADKPVEISVVDLADPMACRDFLAGTKGLVHCAGVVSGADELAYQRGNVQTTQNLVAAAGHVWTEDVRTDDVLTDDVLTHDAEPVFLLVSSLAAHGPASLSAPATEDAPCRPLTAYGRSKRDAEKVLLAGEGAYRKVVLRPPSLYGPRDREFLPLLRAARRGWTVRPGHRLTGLSLVDGRDAAAGAVALLATPSASGVYFVSDRQVGYGWDQLRDILTEIAGRRVRRITLPLDALRAVAGLARVLGGGAGLLLNRDRLRDLDAVGWVCDGSRLSRDTGFTAGRDAATGLRETLDFYQRQGWL